MFDLNPLLGNLLKQHSEFSRDIFWQKVSNILYLHEALSPHGIASLNMEQLYKDYEGSREALQKTLCDELKDFYDRIIPPANKLSPNGIDPSSFLKNQNHIAFRLRLYRSVMGDSLIKSWLADHRTQYRPTLLTLAKGFATDFGHNAYAGGYTLFPHEQLRTFLLECELLSPSFLNGCLFSALEKNEFKAAKKLIEQGADVNAMNENGKGISFYANSDKVFSDWLLDREMKKLRNVASQKGKAPVAKYSHPAPTSFEGLNPCENLVAAVLMNRYYDAKIQSSLILYILDAFGHAGREENPLRLEVLMQHEEIRKALKAFILDKNLPHQALSATMYHFVVNQAEDYEAQDLLGHFKEEEFSVIRNKMIALLGENDHADGFNNFYHHVLVKLFSEESRMDALINTDMAYDPAENLAIMLNVFMHKSRELGFVRLLNSFQKQEIREFMLKQIFNIYLKLLLMKQQLEQSYIESQYKYLRLCIEWGLKEYSIDFVAAYLVKLLQDYKERDFIQFYDTVIMKFPQEKRQEFLLNNNYYCGQRLSVLKEIGKKGNLGLFDKVMKDVVDPENKKILVQETLQGLSEKFWDMKAYSNIKNYSHEEEASLVLLTQCLNMKIDFDIIESTHQSAKPYPIAGTFLQFAFLKNSLDLFKKLITHPITNRTAAEMALDDILKHRTPSPVAGVIGSLLFSKSENLELISRYISAILSKFPDLLDKVEKFTGDNKDEQLKGYVAFARDMQRRNHTGKGEQGEKTTARESTAPGYPVPDSVAVFMGAEKAHPEEVDDIEMQSITPEDDEDRKLREACDHVDGLLAKGAKEAEEEALSSTANAASAPGYPAPAPVPVRASSEVKTFVDTFGTSPATSQHKLKSSRSEAPRISSITNVSNFFESIFNNAKGDNHAPVSNGYPAPSTATLIAARGDSVLNAGASVSETATTEQLLASAPAAPQTPLASPKQEGRKAKGPGLRQALAE